MKKIILSLLFAAVCSLSQAQVKSVEVVNNSLCDVWLMFVGSMGTCTNDYFSQPIVFPKAPAPPTLYIDPSVVPGGMVDAFLNVLGPAGYFNRVRAYVSHPNSGCTAGGSSVTGHGCPGPATTPPMNVEDASCTACGPITVTWIWISPTMARIEIN